MKSVAVPSVSAMAREEHDRDDLFAESTALVERVELVVPGETTPIVAGFRSDGCLSVYFGAEPVFHFNSAGQLRRAFAGSFLWRASGGRLDRLRRQKTESETQLLLSALDDVATHEFVAYVRSRLERLLSALLAGDCRIGRCQPQDADVVGRLRAWLARHAASFVVADAPNAG